MHYFPYMFVPVNLLFACKPVLKPPTGFSLHVSARKQPKNVLL